MTTRQRGGSTRDPSNQRPNSVSAATHSTVHSADMNEVELHPRPSREERIAMNAYLRAADRGFTPGHELEDWLAAERELKEDDGQDRGGHR